MRQSLHILKKDVRYLWREIALVLVLAAFYWLRDAWWVEMLWVFAAAFLIARSIHAEAIPGDRQFWLTRPYARGSLFGAKLAFILLFVNLPMLLAQFLIVERAGFPLRSILPGLFATQALIFLAASLPMAALAAATAGLVPFLSTLVLLLIVGLSFAQRAFPPFRLWLNLESWPESVEWVRDAIGVIALAAIAGCVLYLQYAHRRTRLSRALACAGVLAAAAVYCLIPWRMAMYAQPRGVASSLVVALDTSRALAVVDPNGRSQRRFTDRMQIHIPVRIEGIPEGAEVRGDALAVRFVDARDGRSATAFSPDNPRKFRQGGTTVLDEIVLIDSSFLNAERGQPVTMHAAVYLSLYGDPHAHTVPISSTPVNVMDGLQCSVGQFRQLLCRAAFRWPNRLVYAKDAGGGLDSFYQLISYSPFPGGLTLNPIEEHWTSPAPASATRITIVARDPLAHFRRDLDATGVYIGDRLGQRR
jgi:hypothetical protein